MDSNMKYKNLITSKFSLDKQVVLYNGDCLNLLKQIPDKSIQLIVTSPPYNIGKEYERKISLDEYKEQQSIIIKECERVLSETGSICWQVGNFVNNGTIVPIDIILYPIFAELNLVMRNRIIWHFEHGLHCSKRLSGRYETIIWFTRKTKNYVFNLDPIRIPQKYPRKKYFKGPKSGQFSCNPLGKNPGDIWNIPNVKNNHVEKTEHPCQFPVELIERLTLSLTNKNDWILDPFLGVGSSIIAAILHNRRGVGAEINNKYLEIANERINKALEGNLRTRPMNKPIYDPNENNENNISKIITKKHNNIQLKLFKNKRKYNYENS